MTTQEGEHLQLARRHLGLRVILRQLSLDLHLLNKALKQLQPTWRTSLYVTRTIPLVRHLHNQRGSHYLLLPLVRKRIVTLVMYMYEQQYCKCRNVLLVLAT